MVDNGELDEEGNFVEKQSENGTKKLDKNWLLDQEKEELDF